MTFIPEGEYQKILKSMPIFCMDFLFRYNDEYLLIKRTEQPLKDVYWVIGGRMQFRETIRNFARRVQMREIGRYYAGFKLIGFSNYFFPEVKNARATHTPTLLLSVEVPEKFVPKIDSTHCDYVWSKELPRELLRQTNFIDSYGPY